MAETQNNWKGLRPKWIPSWVSVTFVAFVVFIGAMMFYGESSYVKSNNYTQQINQLKNEIKENRDSAAYYNQQGNELNTDKERLEHIAREKYGMKRLNEDVYRTDIP